MTLLNRVLRASSPQGSIGGRLIALLFGSTFGAAGVAVLWSSCISPVSKSILAQNWPEVPCTILESELTPDQENVLIKYEYHIAQQTYQGDTYSFTDTARNFARASFHQAVENYQAGSTAQVRVNPKDHEESVLDPSIQPIAWMGIFFSTPFITVGICGLTWALGAGWITNRSLQLREKAAECVDKRGAHQIADWLRSNTAEQDVVILFLDGKDRLDGLGLLALCLFWNGIVSVFLFGMILMLISGSVMAWFLGIFLLPFIFIGACILKEMIRSFTGHAAPNYVMVVSPTKPEAGKMTITYQWCFLGDARDYNRIQRVHFLIRRGEGAKGLTKLKRQKEVNEPRSKQPQERLSAEDTSYGMAQVQLDPVPLKSYFRGSVTETYQGSIDLIVNWKMRGEPTTRREYTIGQTDND